MIFNLHEKIEPQFNCMPPRAHYIPFGSIDCDRPKNESNRITMLSKWRFKYFERPSQADLTGVIDGDEITVPSNWQMLGFDSHHYTNAKYPFPYDPPRILRDNPAAVYVTDFTRRDKSSRHYLVFEGVDSCVYLFVNDRLAGYSSVSHCHSEFDITEYLQDENEIRAVVFKWCAGSYLEDQDKLRLSGIFRDVYVISRPEGHIFDYRVKTSLSGDDGIISFSSDRASRLSVYYDGQKIFRTANEQCVHSINIKNVLAWDTENPNLYTVLIECNGEFIAQSVGFRTVEWQNGVLKLNNKPLKFKGVNRHSVTVNGYVESLDDMLKDLRLFKQNNINAVRTSHYPPCADFLALCDKYGILVMDEADIETHGSLYCNGEIYFNKAGFKKLYKELCCNPDWYVQFENRIRRMFIRDRNYTSVVVWSLGNESGFGENFIKAGQMIRSMDDSRPIHYEGTRSYDEKVFYPENTVDMLSWMYPSFEDIKEVVRRRPHRPFVLCEYTHAMGNSCGDVSGYWQLIYNEPMLCGAFVWEWAEHTVYQADEKANTVKKLYGGDFGDYPNDGNFCADGLVQTDRTPNPSLGEIKQAYAPFDVLKCDNGYKVVLRDCFVDPKQIKCRAFLEVDGKRQSETVIDLTHLSCDNALTVAPFYCDGDGYAFVNFEFVSDKAEPLVEKGHIIARRQLSVNTEYKAQRRQKTEQITLIRNEDGYVVRGTGFSYLLDSNGLIRSIDGYNVATGFNISRAAIDNDKNNKFLTANYRPYFYMTAIELKENVVAVKGKYVELSECPVLSIVLTYRFSQSGDVAIDCDFDINPNIPYLPRLGMRFEFEQIFDKVEYFGRGNGEAYEDRIAATPVGWYQADVKDMFFHYTKPQENGSRCNTRIAVLKGNKGQLMVDSPRDFSFSVNRYDESNYPQHDYLLEDSGKLYLCVDYRMAGVGSAACGPLLEPRFRIEEKSARLSFKFRRRISAVFDTHRTDF